MKTKPLKIETGAYKIENVITIQIGESNYKTTASYDILLKKSDSYRYDFLLDRGKISIDGSLPDTKFLSISDQYFSCLFPIHFLDKNSQLVVINFSEITDRIIQKDKELKSNFSGDGIDYISSEFLEKTNSEEKLQRFISSLNLTNALQFSLQKFEEIQHSNWTILPISNTSWEGYSTFDVENNLLEYNAEMKLDPEFIKELKLFATENNSESDFLEFDKFSSELHHETEYFDKNLKFIVAITHINIKLPDLEYNEAFTIKSKTAN